MLHNLNMQDGSNWFAPVKLLPAANAKVVGSMYANNVMYAATSDNCGGVPNGVYAIDLTPVPGPTTSPDGLPVAPTATPASTDVTRWESKGGGIAGIGPAFGRDGTVYVATGDGEYSATAFSDAVVALENKTLKQTDYFTPGKTPFTASPVLFQYNGKDLIAAANQDGRVYLLDASSLGGADHKTPLARSSAAEAATISGLATYEDAAGTRWILASISTSRAVSTSMGPVTNGTIAALKVTTENGVVSVQPAWLSRDLLSPATPTVINGVVFALSTGAARAGGPSGGAVLYALDAATGKELWNSGTTMVGPASPIGPAANDSQVYVVTVDGTLYTFGFQVER
jgi:outer membrane protein assembly factor BamB